MLKVGKSYPTLPAIDDFCRRAGFQASSASESLIVKALANSARRYCATAAWAPES